MDNSYFSRLPPELRNYIGELALTQDTPVKIKSRKVLRKSTRPAFVLFGPNKHTLAFTQICRQLRAETVSLFYASSYCAFNLGNVFPSNRNPLEVDMTAVLSSLEAFLKVPSDRTIHSLFIDIEIRHGFRYDESKEPQHGKNLLTLIRHVTAIAAPKIISRLSFYLSMFGYYQGP